MAIFTSLSKWVKGPFDSFSIKTNKILCDLSLYDIKKIDSMLLCVCSVMDHRGRQSVVRTGVTHSAVTLCYLQFDVIDDLPYLPMYKSTFCSLKIGPKNHPQLTHGSKTGIKNSSGQICITIVSYVNKHPLLHSTSYDVFFLINLSSSS